MQDTQRIHDGQASRWQLSGRTNIQAQRAVPILAQGTALGVHVPTICRLKVCCINLAGLVVPMPQAFSLPPLSLPRTRGVALG
jgi:hypothetical protein